MCSRSIVFEVVVDTIIRGLFFPHFLCITQVPPIASVRGSLCGHDVVRSGGACFVCDLGQVPRYTSCRCWRNAFTSPFDRGDTAGRFDLYFLPFRISHGDGRLWSTGVVLRHNIAK